MQTHTRTCLFFFLAIALAVLDGDGGKKEG